MQENYELLGCVNENGEFTGEYVKRKDFYSGLCPNKRICGVAFWIFDEESNLLLTKRGKGQEQGAGKISPPSGHMQYLRPEIPCEREYPIQTCFREMLEELGLTWNHINIIFTNGNLPIGVIKQPRGSGENCEMIVRHFSFLLSKEGKNKIKNNDGEAIELFFEPWDTAKEKFNLDDNTSGTYKFFGTKKTEVLSALDLFAKRIKDGTLCKPETYPSRNRTDKKPSEFGRSEFRTLLQQRIKSCEELDEDEDER